MDATRFDALVKTLAATTTRRAALTLPAGLGLSRLGLAETSAKRKSGTCKPNCGECGRCKKGDCDRTNGKKRCKKGKCRPKPAGTPCTAFAGGICQNGTCVNVEADEANCGSLGNGCGPTQVCQAGSCFPASTCPAITTRFTFCIGMGVTCGVGCSFGRSAEGNVLRLRDDDFCRSDGLLRCATSADCTAGRACVDVSGCCTDPAVTKGCLLPCATLTT